MSGRKNVLVPNLTNKLVSAGSLSGNLTSSAVNVQYLDNISLQINATGTPTGTFDLQGSLDNSNWVSVTLPSVPTLSGSALSILLDLNQLSFPWIRLVYTRTSGSGSVDIIVSGKAL